jgi:hypothetical protein
MAAVDLIAPGDPDGRVGIFKGDTAHYRYLGVSCAAIVDLIAPGDQSGGGGLFKGGPSLIDMPFVDCMDSVLLFCIQPPCEMTTTPFTGGLSRGETLVGCGFPEVLLPPGDAAGLFKGGMSNDLFVNCLDKPAIIEKNLPMYQGSRSYLEILSCQSSYQLGPSTTFGGGVSRAAAVDCEEIIFAGGGPFFGDTSTLMLTGTACFSITFAGGGPFFGDLSRSVAMACFAGASLGEPTGGYFRGGASAAPGVDCVAPPCLDLEKSVISTASVMPVCAGKTVVLTASPAASRQWQRFTGAAWADWSTDPSVTVAELTDASYQFRLISYGSNPSCVDTSAIFYVEFTTSIPKPTVYIDGSATVCSGGSVALRSSASHAYLWSNGATTQTVWIPFAETGPVSRDYTVTVTDANGCTAVSDPVTLFAGTGSALPSQGIITNTGPVEICAGDVATLSAIPAAAYAWSTGADTQSIDVGAAGKYTVRILDFNGCETTADSVEVVVHHIKPQVGYRTLTVCNGNAIDLSLAPHTSGIQWFRAGNGSAQGTSQILPVATAGDYYAAIDTLGCTFYSDTVTVIESSVEAKITPSRPWLCAGESITLAAGDAAGYEWYFGAARVFVSSQKEIAVDRGGDYKLCVTSADGCRDSAVFAVVEKAITLAPQIVATAGSLDLCPGSSVTLTVQANEPLAGLHIEWSTGDTDVTGITVSDSARYQVTVTDTNGCLAVSDAVAVTVFPTIVPVIETGSGNRVICGSEPLTLFPAETDMNRTYRWLLEGSPVAATPDISITAGGNYSLEITTADGCIFTSAAVYIENAPAPVQPVITTTAPFAIVNDTVWICPNQLGTVPLSSSAASSWLWSNGSSTQSIVPGAVGKFAVRAEYATTCAGVSDTVVIALLDNDVSVDLVENDPHLCPGGTVHLRIVNNSAGVVNSGIAWFDENNVQISVDATLEVSQAGSYYASVSRAGGCVETTDPFEILAYPAVKPEISPAGPVSLCPYDSIMLEASPGEAYEWSTGDTDRQILVKADGAYSVRVTDEYGCIQTSDAVSVSLKPWHNPVITLSADTICQGGTVTLSAPADGQSFLWNDGATDRVVVFNDPDLTGTRRYRVEVTYADGCTYAAPQVSFVVHRNPREPEITRVGSNQVCPDRTLALVATQSEEWTYTWDYSVNELDARIRLPETFNAIVIDKPGWYTVTNTAIATGCSNSHTEYFNLSPASIEIQPYGPVSLCDKGWVELKSVVDPGSNYVAYYWTTGETTPSIIVNNPGYYRVTAYSEAIDPASGATVLCPVQSPSVLVTSTSTVAVPAVLADGPLSFCEGEKVMLTSSLSPTGKYQWYRNQVALGNTWRELEVAESGDYHVAITDNAGCTVASKPVRVTVNSKPEAKTNIEGTITVCAGETVKLTASAGAGYTYRWSPSNATTGSVDAGVGVWTVAVTRNGCQATSAPVTVKESAQRAPEPSVAPAGVCPGEKATLTATVTGVNDPDFIWWDAAVNGNAIGYGPVFETPALTADYDVWVSAGSDVLCESPRHRVTVQVGQVAGISFITPYQLSVCNFDQALTLAAFPVDGVFSGAGVLGSSFDPATAGTGTHQIYYSVDRDGCISVDSIEIEVRYSPQVFFNNLPAGADMCADGQPVIIDVSPQGGQLSGDGLAGFSFDPQAAGVGDHWLTYTVTDATCTTKDSIKISVWQPPTPTITGNTTVCENVATPYSVIGLAGAPGDYTCAWTAMNGTIQGNSDLSTVSVIWAQAATCELEVVVTHTVSGCTAVSIITVLLQPATGPIYRVPNRD